MPSDAGSVLDGSTCCFRTDQGPDFTCKAMNASAYARGIQLRLIPGRQADAERLRRELQRQVPRRVRERALFSSLADARHKIATWHIDNNQNRPPAEFADAWRSRQAGAALLTGELS